MQIAKERQDKQIETIAYTGLAYAYSENNNIQTAIEYYKKALKIAKEREDKKK